MAIRYGGADSNEALGLRMTVEAPDGTTSTNPVKVGEIFKLGGTDADGGGYKLVAAADNDTPDSVVMVQASERMTVVGPMTVRVLGRYSQIQTLPYLAAEVPSVGGSIQISATVRKVGAATFAAGSYVLNVDTATEEVEVLV